MLARVVGISIFGMGMLSLFACGKATTGGGGGAPNAATTVTAIANGVKAVGQAMATARDGHARVSSTDCDTHGYPNVSQSDGRYPGHLTYCFTTVNTGDTVLGGFSTPTAVSCLLTVAGVTYDGAPHSVPVSSSMLTACSLPAEDIPVGTMMTLTGSAPASFNTNYANGVIVDLSSSLGLTFKIAMNTAGTKSSFLTSESWTDGSIGTTAGSMDSATGDLWYESRVERFNCSTSSRCGWNRHTRIRAGLTMSGGSPTGLSSISFGYSNIQTPPGQSGLGGLIVTASGDLTSGIKARYWSSTNGSGGAPASTADYNTASKWSETTNSRCYTHSSETATTCGTGLAAFTSSTKFLLNGTSDSHVTVASWLGSITGQTFSAVDMSADTQF